MNYKLFSALTFVAGVTIGSVVTWKLVEKKYQQIAQEEIESVKETFANRPKPSIDECVDEIIRQTDNKPDVMEYAAKIAELKYTGSENTENNTERKEDEDSMDDEPVIITAEEFEEGDYTAETLTLYKDGVLTNWYEEPINPEDYVGREAVDNFDKYADGDTVFVRNHAREMDYEIQRDLRNYTPVTDDNDESAED